MHFNCGSCGTQIILKNKDIERLSGIYEVECPIKDCGWKFQIAIAKTIRELTDA